MNKTYPVFDAYNVRTACLQLNFSENTNQRTGKPEGVVFLTMAPTLDKSVDMSLVRQGGIKLFDYDNKTVMKLEKHEIASIAKLKNPYFVKKYTTPALDYNGNPKKDERGNNMLYKDVFIHADNRKGSSTTLSIGHNQQDDTGCSVSTFFKQGQMYKNCIIYLNTNQTQELAYAAEWCLFKIYEASGIERKPYTQYQSPYGTPAPQFNQAQDIVTSASQSQQTTQTNMSNVGSIDDLLK